ncbi:hypothetical protein SAMD00019534_054180 [Acytostelium subglobosum LB1]|uniref:hypothetical protein n=1 Tax=Acytostelium subglobosum LB1 TaxID=1410327 RepID=UPI000644BB99|nr:hypothetical protein SAMD00019534_054180 [Acytostelium subglobosum LB1]GAM22243.1 hypothetical protein SAMD00019534_054180 [Acytostelium subglobosum LB1]|eukprot:XP_012754363.1 hypothetical protein SAMD00019534_054180 [Acytostelium subglobosum LB1]
MTLNEGLFERTLKYGIAVPMSRSDQLRSYIGQSLESLRPHLSKKVNPVEKISLTILNEYDHPIERFSFTFNNEVVTPDPPPPPPPQVVDQPQQHQQQPQQQQNYMILDGSQDGLMNDPKEYYFNMLSKVDGVGQPQPQPQQPVQQQQQQQVKRPTTQQLEDSFRAYLLRVLAADSFLQSSHLSSATERKFVIHVHAVSIESTNNVLDIDPLNPPGRVGAPGALGVGGGGVRVGGRLKEFKPVWVSASKDEYDMGPPSSSNNNVVVSLKTIQGVDTANRTLTASVEQQQQYQAALPTKGSSPI